MPRAALGSLVVVTSLIGATFATGMASGAASTARPPASAGAAALPDPGKPLGEAAVAVARQHLAAHREEFGLDQAEVSDLAVSSWVPSDNNGLTNVYFQQRLNSLDVAEGLVNVAVRSDGSVMRVASNAVASAAKLADDATPGITDVAAARLAAASVGLRPTEPFASDDLASGADRERLLGDGGISTEAIPARLVYQRTDKGGLRLAWELGINQLDGQHWWQIRMDADTGAELATNDWVAADSHDVFPVPVEAPSFATPVNTRTVVSNPATAASPFGWNDTNGAAGAESTLTTGNNVNAYTDVDANNVPDPGSSPDGTASLNFDFPLDLTQAPSAYRPAAVENLYFTSNRVHDITYRYGFTEAAGNFQVNNYGHGGAGADPVLAEAQDGSGTNNANFATPPDGASPRMQMYVWTAPTPAVDGDLDNGVIIHEYGHGISNRLTGGPANASCLSNNEQAGEGWSDYFSYMLTMPNGTQPAGGRGIGTYALAQPTTGVGIRTQRYSTDTGINNETYDSIKTMVIPHGVGEVWAEMLWEMTYALIGQYGFSADLINGNAGNNKSLQLVMDGLKLQPCNPGFVDARNAILAADQADYAGANQCLIWKAFAKRGLGFSASQGAATSTTDGTQAFDLPASCLGLSVTRTATPSPVPAQRTLTYGYHVVNTKVPAANLDGISVTGAVGAHATYVPGSATCAGTFDAGTQVVTFPIGTLGSGASVDCEFKVVIDASPFTVVKLEDDLEPDLSGWAASHGGGTVDWTLTTTNPHSPTHAAFATDPAVVTDQYLTSTTPIAVTTDDQLRFWHTRGLESGFDGGVVEVSSNGGGSWTDIGDANWVTNGYNATISAAFSSPIAGRRAFSGTSGYVESVANLTPWVGQSVLIRFRAASDISVGNLGWTVDDIFVGSKIVTTSLGTTKATGVPDQSGLDVVTTIVAPVTSAPDAPTVTGSTPSTGAVSTAFTPGFDGGSPVSAYGVECVSTNGGAAGAASGAGSPLTVSGLSAGKSYHCRVQATNALGAGPFSTFGPTVLVPAVVAPPPPPTVSKPGRPKIKKAIVLTSATAKVKFTKASTGGGTIVKYQVSCKSKDGGKVRKASGKKSPITVKKLTSGAHYTCKVRARNQAGWGPWSKHSKKFAMPAKAKGREVVIGG